MPEIMNTKKKVTFYPPEFKSSAIKLALESGRPVTQIALELGVKHLKCQMRCTPKIRPKYKVQKPAKERTKYDWNEEAAQPGS